MRPSLTLEHCRWMILELFRQPSYVISTVAFPSLFFLIFGVPEAKTVEGANMLLASFASFAVFGVVFLQFGVGLAQERAQTWYFYLKTLPVRTTTLFWSRFLCAIFFSVLAAGGVVLCALTWTKASLSAETWVMFLLLLIFLSFVFCPMGLILGRMTSPKTSLPVGNLFYLPLSFLGGLWMPPRVMPEVVRDLSGWMPTRHYGEVMWAAVGGVELPRNSFVWLLCYFCGFSVIAWWCYRGDTVENKT